MKQKKKTSGVIRIAINPLYYKSTTNIKGAFVKNQDTLTRKTWSTFLSG